MTATPDVATTTTTGTTDPSAGPAPYATPDDLRTAMVDAEVFFTTAVDGVYHRAYVWERALRALEEYVAAQRVVPAPPARFFAPVMPRSEFLLTDYVRSFPDLTGSIDVFTGDDKAHRALLETLDEGGDWTAHLEPSEVVLASSVCHPLYGVLPHDVPEQGLDEECRGWSFRHEPSLDPARMQCFRIWEFVKVGTPQQAKDHRDEWKDRGLAALQALQLPVRAEAANDPFFGRVGRMLAANQLSEQLKYELVVDLTEVRPTAIGSTNYHEDHFGAPFELRTPDGATAHSACIGFGLDRITLALFAIHGPDPAGWPSQVRELLHL